MGNRFGQRRLGYEEPKRKATRATKRRPGAKPAFLFSLLQRNSSVFFFLVFCFFLVFLVFWCFFQHCLNILFKTCFFGRFHFFPVKLMCIFEDVMFRHAFLQRQRRSRQLKCLDFWVLDAASVFYYSDFFHFLGVNHQLPTLAQKRNELLQAMKILQKRPCGVRSRGLQCSAEGLSEAARFAVGGILAPADENSSTLSDTGP